LAFLISFALPDGNAQPASAKMQIGDIEGDELGAAERAGKTKQEEGAVTEPFDISPGLSHHCEEFFGGSRCLPCWCVSRGPPNASQRCFYRFGICRRLIT
jgi:hypothetical protein